MKIAQIAPLWNNVSSRGPSDGERALSSLTEELVRQGHEVTLFAGADSRTSATREVLCSTATRSNAGQLESGWCGDLGRRTGLRATRG